MSRFFILCSLIFSLGCTSTSLATKTQQIPKHVILISMDGAAPYVIDKSDMPTFKNMAKQGAVSWTAQTINPSITLPSHTSMTTGVGPEIHGVLWNDWFPEKGVVQVPTIFSIAKSKGISTALVASKPKFRHLEVPHSLDHLEIVPLSAPGLADAAMKVFKDQRPGLMMIHFRDPDYAGHSYGWGSTQQKKALHLVDQSLDKILKTLTDLNAMKDTLIIISADHGGHAKTHGTNMKEDMTIPWLAYGYKVHPSVMTQEIRTTDTAATILWMLGIAVPPEIQGKPVEAAFNL